jgi:hypothetical protein
MGSPFKEDINKMSYKQDIINFLDSILAENGTTADGEPNKLKNAPDEIPEEEYEDLEDELGYDEDDMDSMAGDVAGGEYDEDEDEEDEDEENEVIEMASKMVDTLILEQDNRYQEYFRGVMKKHGFDTLTQMRDDQKKSFFKDIKRGWNGVKSESADYEEYFKDMMKKNDIDKIEDLSDEKKKDFFNKVDAGWKSKEESGISELVYKPGVGYKKGILQGQGLTPKERQKALGKSWSVLHPKSTAPTRTYNVRGTGEILGQRLGKVKEQMMSAYKKYFYEMAENIGIDVRELNEEERVEFYSLVNEAFVAFHLMDINELMQKPGEGYEKGLVNPQQKHVPLKPRQRAKAEKIARRKFIQDPNTSGWSPVRMYAKGGVFRPVGKAKPKSWGLATIKNRGKKI